MTIATVNQTKRESREQELNPSEMPTTRNNSAKEKSRGSELKRMTIALPPETAKMLELLSELQGITQIEALRRAISTEAFIQREIKNGSRVLVESSDNHVKELVFR